MLKYVEELVVDDSKQHQVWRRYHAVQQMTYGGEANNIANNNHSSWVVIISFSRIWRGNMWYGGKLQTPIMDIVHQDFEKKIFLTTRHSQIIVSESHKLLR